MLNIIAITVAFYFYLNGTQVNTIKFKEPLLYTYD